MKLGVIILAAGKGTRMRSALPKVLHPLAGRPLIHHVLDAAQALGAVRVCCVCGHGGQQVMASLAERDCDFVEQRERLGTGHAVMQAMPSMEDIDRVLILYGDVPLIEPETLNRLVADSAHTALGLLTIHVNDPTGYGRIVRNKTGSVCRIVEHKDAAEPELEIKEVNTGIIVAERSALADWLGQIDNRNVKGEYYLTDIIGIATANGVEVATTTPSRPEEVAGINDRVQLAALERYYQQRVAACLMRNGTSIADPARIDVRGTLVCERDVALDVNLVCEGRVHLGANVRIGPNCLLKNCEIGPDTEILAYSMIEGTCVGAGSRIGPFARLRPGAMIGDECHVGNFVEIKQSQLATGTKVNHLSYIGDADIGEQVNIGAGTITCNYDGARKHRTQIGDDAFIGSNTALVAPVAVGAGATIGAGSVITCSTPAGKLTLSRPQQLTLEHWQRPRKDKT